MMANHSDTNFRYAFDGSYGEIINREAIDWGDMEKQCFSRKINKL